MTDLTIQSTIPASVGRMRKTLDAQASAVVADGTFLRLRGEGNASAGHFTADDARRLGEWLSLRYGLAPYTTAKSGEVVRILPNAERYDGDSIDFEDMTRAKVLTTLDHDGEYRVEALDGDDKGDNCYVAAEFVRHADAILPEAEKPAETPAPRFAVGTPAVIVTDDAQDNIGALAGLAKGTPVVINGDMPSGSYRVTAHIGGELKTRHVRAEDVALAMLAGTPATPAPKTGPLEVGEEAVFLEDYTSRFYKGDRVKVLGIEDRHTSTPLIRFERLSDGERGGAYAYRLARPEAERPWAVGDEAIVTDGGRYADGFRTGERVQITHVGTRVDENGHRQVRATSTERYGVNWYTRTDSIRRP